MRSEIQHWDQVRANVEVIVAGAGQTGLTPTVAVQRLSDGQWLANGGGSWAAGFATNNMTEVDAVNAPGLYTYAVPSARLTYSQGLEGYRFKIVEATNSILEYVHVDVQRSDLVEPVTGSPTSYGIMLQSVLDALVYTADANGEDATGYFDAGAFGDPTGVKFYFGGTLEPVLGGHLVGRLALLMHYDPEGVAYLVRITGYGNDGTPYVEMEALDGTDLSTVASTPPDRLYILNAMGPTATETTAIVETVGDGLLATLPASIADAVLDEPVAGHTTAGTLGEFIRRMYGQRENYRFVPSAWASNGQPTAGLLLFYDSAAALAADTGPAWSGAVGRTTIAASFSGDNLTAYTASKSS